MFKTFYRAKEISFQLHSKLLSDESSDCMNSIRIRNFHNVHDLPLTRESYSLCNEFLSLEQGEKNKLHQMLLHKQNKAITFNTIAGIHGHFTLSKLLLRRMLLNPSTNFAFKIRGLFCWKSATKLSINFLAKICPASQLQHRTPVVKQIS